MRTVPDHVDGAAAGLSVTLEPTSMASQPSSPGPSRTPSPPELEGVRWYALPTSEVGARLGLSGEGLTGFEIEERRARFGLNTIPEEAAVPWWKIFLLQFADPLIYILLVAAAVTLALGDYVDSGVIFAVVLLNALIGFVQEARAQQAMRALARMSAPRASVVRDGVTTLVPAAELVPGDLVVLESGARVPADLRLLHTVDLLVDESALTGESVPVRKHADRVIAGSPVQGDQVNLAFASTMVSRGRGRGFVIRTGTDTELGRIARAVQARAGGRTPLQEVVGDFGRRIGVVAAGLALLVAALGALRGLAPGELFLTAVAVAVSAIPEGLPVVLTVTLAVSVRRMAARRAIVRKLPAVETLGSTTVIASDKTGTLTWNQMTVRAISCGGTQVRVTGGGYALEGRFFQTGSDGVEAELVPVEGSPQAETLVGGALANEADAHMVGEEGEPLGDPTEVALLVAAAKGGLHPEALRRAMPRLELLPFEPERRFMAVLVRGASADPEDHFRNLIYMKGAPEAVLARCDRELGPDGPRPLTQENARAAADDLAAEGLRVLAVARRETGGHALDSASLDGDFTLCGFVGMEDPVRPEAVEAVQAVRRAGLRVLMLTGDHLATARTIGAQLGLGESHEALEGSALDAMSDEALDEALRKGTDVFARVAPEHKLRIVERLRAMGEIVAVTGDGVNDAPALRAAHLGIAMGLSGTDVAREASDMVLQDDNFATIRAAVEEGRLAFANLRKVTFFLLSTAVGEVVAILLALAAGWPLPFVAVQILWINLVTNGLQDVALAVEPAEPGLMSRGPRQPGEGILPGRLLRRLGAVGAVLAAGTLAVFLWTLENTGDLDTARTMAMTQMVVFQFFHVFNCRSLDRSIFRVAFFSNPLLFLSMVAALLAQLAVLYWAPLQAVFRTVPLDAAQWAVVLVVGTLVIVGGELDKGWQRRRGRSLG
jgi:magnesium-transporting ATPase (P-type)